RAVLLIVLSGHRDSSLPAGRPRRLPDRLPSVSLLCEVCFSRWSGKVQPWCRNDKRFGGVGSGRRNEREPVKSKLNTICGAVLLPRGEKDSRNPLVSIQVSQTAFSVFLPLLQILKICKSKFSESKTSSNNLMPWLNKEYRTLNSRSGA